MAPLQFHLVMRSGPGSGKTYDLDKDEVFIGRDPNNDVVINDAEVSRRHAQINRQPGSFVIEDLGSTNGTFVNRVRLSGTRVLQPGDNITLGENVTLTFELVQTEPEPTVASSPQSEKESPPQPATPFPSERFTQPEIAPQPALYSGQIPPSPVEPPPPQSKPKSDNRLLFGCIGLTVLLCILVVLALVVIDQLNIWCEVLPFLPGC